MFSTSSQRKHWTFADEAEILTLKAEANERYVLKKAAQCPGFSSTDFFLSVGEELVMQRHYEYALKEFCSKFKPAMPRSVIGYAIAYFKRFYLKNSFMDYHPKDIMLTSVYLACKVDEFNVSLRQFVGNLRGDRDKLADTVLWFELLLMQQLNYNLTVHCPYRPLEGLLLGLKTLCPHVDAESLRETADLFIDRSLNTNACFLASPSQIALAALAHSAAQKQVDLSEFVRRRLLATAGDGGAQLMERALQQVERVQQLVRGVPTLSREELRAVDRKLEGCREPANNPASDEFQRRMQELLEDEDERQLVKYSRHNEEQQRLESELLGP